MSRRTEQLEEELRKMNKELKSATDAEEKSRKAMDELAYVVRHVAAEATEAKKNLKSAQSELKAVREEKEQISRKLHSTEDRLAAEMAECNKFKNMAERLRLEADETLAAWIEKESGLVGCMREVEEERSRAKAENSVLQEEMKKLRDILKQAMIEDTAAKKETAHARVENSQLKDNLAEKDTALNFISRELDSLRLSEAAARRSLTDLKLQLPDSSSESLHPKPHNIRKIQEEIKPATPRLSDPVAVYKHNKVRKTFSFDLGCSGRHKQLHDLVDNKARNVVRGGSDLARAGTLDGASLTPNMPPRFPDRAHISRQSSLRKKTLFMGFGEFLSKRSSKSPIS